MPGHGETDGGGCDLEHPDDAADLICGALDALGVVNCDLVGCGAGASLQVEVALRHTTRAHSLTLVGALDLTRDPSLQSALRLSYAVPAPDSHGGYLLRAWHEVRDHLLFFPWYERRREFALGAPCLQPALLQSLTRDVLLAREAGVALRRAEIGYPLLERLARLRIVARHAARVSDPRHAHSRALAGAASHFTTLSQETARCSRELISLIDLEPP
jgi:pimeloyl-ACP methyl ester carboxylesterase